MSAGAGGAAASTGYSSSKAATSSAQSVSASLASSSSGPMQPTSCPDWPGWLVYEDFPAATFCYPADASALPGLITWELCPANSGFTSGCRDMKITWPVGKSTMEATPSIDTSVTPPLLQYTRNSIVPGPPYYRMMIVTELDGPAHTAFLDPSPNLNGYIFNNSTVMMGVRNGRYIERILDYGMIEHPPETIIGAGVDTLKPTILWSTPSGDGHGFGTSDTQWGTFDSYEIDIAAIGGKLTKVLNGGSVGGLQQTNLYFWHDLALWQSGDLTQSNIMAYTPTKGLFTFITFDGDYAQSAKAIGTDGTDMVWVHGSQRQPPDLIYPVQDIVTSPYTEDPTSLNPVRLRSFPVTNATNATYWPFAVGCGYAAYSYTLGHALVVRLSDGWSWDLPASGCVQGPSEWCWQEVYAVTCDEVFLRGAYDLQTIARVRLDALGPGMPPD